MASTRTTRTPAGREHRNIVEEAGIGRISLIAIAAGTLAAYGAFALLAAIVGAILEAADVETNLNFKTNDWTGETAGSALATAVTLFLAYLFGGYVAGRLARRSGMLHGLGVFLLGVIAAAVIGGVVSALTDNNDLNENLRNVGIPTTADQWGNVGIAGGILALVLMAAGAILGGVMGERWHTKLARRAADPNYGPEAEERRKAELAEEERERRLAADTPVRRDADATDDRFRDDNRPAGATVPGGDRDGDRIGPDRAGDDEPRYTASEWAEQQKRRPT